MKQQITTYNQHGHPVVLDLDKGDSIIYDRYHNPTVLKQDYDYEETKEGWINTFPKKQ